MLASTCRPILLATSLLGALGCGGPLASGPTSDLTLNGVQVRYHHPAGKAHVSNRTTAANEVNETVMEATGGPGPDVRVAFRITPDLKLIVNARDYGAIGRSDRVDIDADRAVRVNGRPRAAVGPG